LGRLCEEGEGGVVTNASQHASTQKKKIHVIATTGPDLHGDQLSLDQLRYMHKLLTKFSLPITMFHDSMLPPRGALGSVEMVEIGSGEFALVGTPQAFEERVEISGPDGAPLIQERSAGTKST
jgi:hypothetical protein